jgi:hypothetical protein
MCCDKEAPHCTVKVPESCANDLHLVWRICGNTKPPLCTHNVHTVCVGLPTGEKHIVTHKCCKMAPNVCTFCTEELQLREELKEKRAELAQCAHP